MSEDMHIGFLQKPKGLEEFLELEGFEKEEEIDETMSFYKPESSLELVYYPTLLPAEDEEEPNWQKEGFGVAAELNITYNSEDGQKSITLADTIREKFPETILFDGVQYIS